MPIEQSPLMANLEKEIFLFILNLCWEMLIIPLLFRVDGSLLEKI